MSDEECPGAAEFIAYVPQRIVLFVQLFFCIITIVINLVFIRRWRKNLFFHINCRILLWTIIIVNIGHSVFLGPLQGFHLYKIYTATEPCDVLVSAAFCYSLRLPTTTCLYAHTAVHFSIVIERAMALRHPDTYESRTSTAGITLTILSIVASFGVIIFAMSDYDFIPKQIYCTAVTTETLFKVSVSSITTVILEAFTIICFFCVYYANSKQSNVYFIRMKYQARENLLVLRLLIPLVIFHFLVYNTFLIAFATAPMMRSVLSAEKFRAYIAIVYVVPIYTACSPILLWYILRHYQLSRSKDLAKMSAKVTDANNVYFSNYAWNVK